MAKTLTNSDKPTHEEIAQRAYALYEKSGRVPGRDMENWLAAESQLIAARKRETESTSTAKPAARPVAAVRQPALSRAA
jgi:hypothetical protein